MKLTKRYRDNRIGDVTDTVEVDPTEYVAAIADSVASHMPDAVVVGVSLEITVVRMVLEKKEAYLPHTMAYGCKCPKCNGGAV